MDYSRSDDDFTLISKFRIELTAINEPEDLDVSASSFDEKSQVVSSCNLITSDPDSGDATPMHSSLAMETQTTAFIDNDQLKSVTPLILKPSLLLDPYPDKDAGGLVLEKELIFTVNDIREDLQGYATPSTPSLMDPHGRKQQIRNWVAIYLQPVMP